jgi:AcrR family transcriptional regulator
MKAKTEQRRLKVFEVARRCLFRDGYSKLTLKDVAAGAGVSRAWLYLQFKNKQDLFVRLYEGLHDEYSVRSREILGSALSDDEKLAAIMEVWVIDPYRTIQRSAAAPDWLKQLQNVSDQSEMKYRHLFRQSIVPLKGEEIADLIVMAVKGLMDDRPSLKVLQKRVKLLIRNL